MKKILLATAAATIVILSCKKEDKKCDLNPSNITGTYKVASLKYKADAATPEVDLFPTLDACEKDDLLIFNASGSATLQDGGVKCDPPGDDEVPWSLSGNTLTFDGDSYTVSHFDCNNTTITQEGSTPGELTTISLTRQ